LTEAEIEALKQIRYDHWHEYVTNPPVTVEEPNVE
jgi:hypothetical protein